jgi:sugar/nucleoside kinase (ribokinase family)
MVTTAGEAMACLAAPQPGPLALGGSLTLTVAGAESNVAIALARLGHEVAWIGRLGDDELGELVLRTLRGEGVDVGRVRRDGEAPTGLMVKERRLGTRTRVHYYRAGSAGSRLAPADVEGDADVVHLTGITPALGPGPRAAVETLAERATTLSFDVNFRARLWPSPAAAREALTPLARRARIVFADAGELELVGGAGALLEAGVEVVVVKRGADGAEAVTRERTVRSAAPAVTAVDTVGAGDALCAGFLSGRLDGLPVDTALDRAVRVAAFAVASAGDWEGLPRRAELALLDVEEGGTVR